MESKDTVQAEKALPELTKQQKQEIFVKLEKASDKVSHASKALDAAKEKAKAHGGILEAEKALEAAKAEHQAAMSELSKLGKGYYSWKGKHYQVVKARKGDGFSVRKYSPIVRKEPTFENVG